MTTWWQSWEGSGITWVAMLVKCFLWSHLGQWCYAFPIIKWEGESWRYHLVVLPSLCYFLNSKQKVTKAFWDKWFVSVDGMEWDGAWKRGKWSYIALLVVSDKKPTKTVSSKIKDILAPKTGKPKWMELGAAWLEPRILNYGNFNFNESLKLNTSKNFPISMVFMGWFKSFKWQV